MDNEQLDVGQGSVKNGAGNRFRYVVFALLLALLAIEVAQYFMYRQKLETLEIRLSSMVDDLDWRLRTRSWNLGSQNISLEVGRIQFLENGFTLTLEQAEFESGSVVLAGEIGNPKNIDVSSLTLTFTVYDSLYNKRKEFLSQDWNDRLFLFADQISRVQSSPISRIGPGQTAKFEVKIPGVTQENKDELRVILGFSGARYSYGS